MMVRVLIDFESMANSFISLLLSSRFHVRLDNFFPFEPGHQILEIQEIQQRGCDSYTKRYRKDVLTNPIEIVQMSITDKYFDYQYNDTGIHKLSIR